MVFLAGFIVVAQSRPITTSPNLPVQKVQRNYPLEQAALNRADNLKTTLQPAVRAKLDLVTRRLLTRLASGPNSEGLNFTAIVQQDLRRNFPQISVEQSNLLSFYVLAEVARNLSASGGVKMSLDGMSEMSEMRSLRLQMMMDRKSQLIRTLSNIMKQIATTQDGLVQNIK